MNEKENLQSSAEQEILVLLSYLKEAVKYFLRRFYIPLIGLGVGLFLAHQEIKEFAPTYTAVLKFVRNTDIGSSGGQEINIPNFGGGGTSSNKNPMSEIMVSDIVLKESLFRLQPDSSDFLINQFVEVYFPDDFDSNKFTSNELNAFSERQLAIYKSILSRIKSSNSTLFKVSPETIITLTSATLDQELSMGLVQNIYEAFTEFYDQNSTTSMSETLSAIIRKRDSTKLAMLSFQTQLAAIQNKDGLNIRPSDYITAERLKQEIEMAKGSYTRYSTDVESRRTSLSLRKPAYSLLSQSIPPLNKSFIRPVGIYLNKGLVGLGVGIIITFILFFLSKFWYYYKRA